MINPFLSYIGPGMALSTVVIVIAISLLVLASLGFTIYLTIKRILKRKK